MRNSNKTPVINVQHSVDLVIKFHSRPPGFHGGVFPDTREFLAALGEDCILPFVGDVSALTRFGHHHELSHGGLERVQRATRVNHGVAAIVPRDTVRLTCRFDEIFREVCNRLRCIAWGYNIMSMLWNGMV